MDVEHRMGNSATEYDLSPVLGFIILLSKYWKREDRQMCFKISHDLYQCQLYWNCGSSKFRLLRLNGSKNSIKVYQGIFSHAMALTSIGKRELQLDDGLPYRELSHRWFPLDLKLDRGNLMELCMDWTARNKIHSATETEN